MILETPNGPITITMDVKGPLEEELFASTGSSEAWEQLVEHLHSSASILLKRALPLLSAARHDVKHQPNANKYAAEASHGRTVVTYGISFDLNVPLDEKTATLMGPILLHLQFHAMSHLKDPLSFDQAHDALRWHLRLTEMLGIWFDAPDHS